MVDQPKWKDFEQLVAAIEVQAAPRGAQVASPDRIRDLITGQMREVDASIRFRAGTTEVLITIECRDRSRKADDTWIDQLATKRQKVGASKTIAVSAAGFTKSALETAKHHGIEIRELSEIGVADIEDWFLPHGIVHLFRLIENTKCTVALASQPDDPQEIDANEPVLLHKLVHKPFPAVAFLNFIEMTDPKRFWAVPLDGSKTQISLELYGSDCNLIPVPLGVPKPEGVQLHLLRDNEELEVSKVTLSFQISYEAAAFSPDDGTHHLYGAPGESKIQHSQFDGEVFGLPVKFEHQSADDVSSATVRFPSGLTLPFCSKGHSKGQTFIRS